MRVLLLASNLKSAGGLTIGLNVIKALKQYYPQHQFVVLAPPDAPEYASFKGENISVVAAPFFITNPLLRLFFENLWMPGFIRKHKPDVIFAMGNFAVKTRVKQAVLFCYPFAAFPNDKQVWSVLPFLERIDVKLRVKLMGARFRYADVVFPQTNIIAQKLRHNYPGIKRLCVVPNAFSAVGKGTKQHEGFRFLQRTSGLIYLLVFTRYYPQKNLEILPEVAKLIKEKGLPYRIIFTLEPEQHPGARQLLELINASDLGDIIINLGNIPFNEVEVLYQEVDALLLPTVLESFSTTYADAMFYRKPIITSNLDFALEVCRDAAWYFEPKDPHSILAAIEDAFCNPAKLQEKIELAHQYSLAMPDWEQVTKSYMGVLEELSVFPAV